MKSFTSFILTVSNSLRGSKLFEYLKLPVPLEARRLYTHIPINLEEKTDKTVSEVSL